jgi:G8 domain-containing protein
VTEIPRPRDVGRRAFLKTAALAGASLAIAPKITGGSAPRVDRTLWSDPSTWGGRVPSQDDVAVIARRVVLDRDVRVAGLVVERGGDLVFDPDANRTVESTGNVVVRGRLSMEPASPQTIHRLVFRGVDEDAFVGGGMDVVRSDVGLWVMNRGVLQLAGSSRRPWTRAVGEVPAGAVEVTLQDDPDGWQVGDELVITPTVPPTGGDDSSSAAQLYDDPRIKAISGRTIQLSSATRFDHPAVDVVGTTYTAEVLNLTRNVRIQGTRRGRSHVFIRSTNPQVIKDAAFRHLGPRQRGGGASEFVLGRYGLHFHMCFDSSRGSVVSGTVVRDCGSHAFVPHLSNGVSFLDCISHNTFEDAYWWDDAPDTRTSGDPTHDVLYSKCVASLAKSHPEFRGYRLTGFFLGRGKGNVARDCVAVGIRGNADASGFIWPEGSEGVWEFQDCLAHNNAVNGIFVWQNTDRVHVIDRFVAYHNGNAGIEHGAYLNAYVYRDVTLVGNAEAGVQLHAESSDRGDLRFERTTIDGAGITRFGFLAFEATLNGAPAVVCSPAISGVRREDFALGYSGDSLEDRFDVRSSC